jgi:hypothetical protein
VSERDVALGVIGHRDKVAHTLVDDVVAPDALQSSLKLITRRCAVRVLHPAVQHDQSLLPRIAVVPLHSHYNGNIDFILIKQLTQSECNTHNMQAEKNAKLKH